MKRTPMIATRENRAEIEHALANERLIVKVGKSWFLAKQVRMHEWPSGDFIIQIVAGPHNARGMISNFSAKESREFFILSEK